MLKRTAILLVIAGCLSCQARRPDLTPPSAAHYRSLSIKFSFHGPEGRQSGRVSWRFDDASSRFLFFNALNQSGMELDVAAEEAVLVDHGKKAFWHGDFSELLDRIWGIDLTLADLKSLLAGNGTMPAGLPDRGIAVTLERAAGSGALEAVRLRRGASDLSLRILKDERRPGRIVLIDYAGRYQPRDLEGMLEND